MHSSDGCTKLAVRHSHAGGAQLPQHDLDSTAFKAVQFKAKVLSFNTRTGFASAQIQVRATDTPHSERSRRDIFDEQHSLCGQQPMRGAPAILSRLAHALRHASGHGQGQVP